MNWDSFGEFLKIGGLKSYFVFSIDKRNDKFVDIRRDTIDYICLCKSISQQVKVSSWSFDKSCFVFRCDPHP